MGQCLNRYWAVPGMSTFTRYAFAVFISLYGVYQKINQHFLPGVLAIFLALFVLWISGRR